MSAKFKGHDFSTAFQCQYFYVDLVSKTSGKFVSLGF